MRSFKTWLMEMDKTTLDLTPQQVQQVMTKLNPQQVGQLVTQFLNGQQVNKRLPPKPLIQNAPTGAAQSPVNQPIQSRFSP